MAKMTEDAQETENEADSLALHAAKDAERQAKKSLKALEKRFLVLQEQFDTLAGIKEPLGAIPKIPAPTRKKGDKHPAVAVALASDWHVGENVPLSVTNGLNEYDPSIAEQRANRFFDRTRRLIELCRDGSHVDTLVLALAGDLITGYLHDDQRQTNYLSPTEEFRFLKRLLRSGIDYLLEDKTLRQIVLPCSWGNHGRTNYDKREMYGLAGFRNSFESMLYLDLAEEYLGNDRLTFTVTTSDYQITELEGGYRIRTSHGNHFGYSGGIGGLTIPLNKFIARLNDGVHCHLSLMGHWHSYTPTPMAIINGTNKGVDAYSMKKGFTPEPAQQAFTLIDPASKRRLIDAPIFTDRPEEWEKRRRSNQ